MGDKVRILLLGAGPVGASIGLALGRSSDAFERIGFDPDRRQARRAAEAGAFDRTIGRPREAAADADLVLLCLGAHPAGRALDDLAGRLRQDVVILGVTQGQAAILEAWRTRLGPSNPYVAAVPFLGAARALAAVDPEPSADRFDGGLVGVAAPPGTPEAAVDVALDLATILGAQPFFLEAAELDSAAATSEQLPAAMAAALIESLSANPGWRDQRRLVGPRFARLADLIDDLESQGSAAEWTANRDHLAARLEAVIGSLTALRSILLQADAEGLEQRLDRVAEEHRDWRRRRAEDRPDHGYEAPGVPRIRLLDRLLGRRPRR